MMNRPVFARAVTALARVLGVALAATLVAADPPLLRLVSADHHRCLLEAAGWPVAAAELHAKLAWIGPHEADRAARIETAIANLGASSYTQRERASAELRALGPSARSALVRAADSPDLEVRRRAAALLDQTEQLEDHIVQAVLYLAFDRDPASRDAVLRCALHGPAILRAPSVLEALFVQVASDPPDLLWLRTQLASPEPRLRAAASGLVAASTNTPEHDADAIERLLVDPSPEVRLAAARAVAPWRPDAAVDALVELLGEGDRDGRRAAHDVLAAVVGGDAWPHWEYGSQEGHLIRWREARRRWYAAFRPEAVELASRWEVPPMATASHAVSAAFSPSGRWLAVAHKSRPSGTERSRLVLWNVPVARVFDELDVSYEPSTCVTFGSERRVYVGGRHGSVDVRSLWYLGTETVAVDLEGGAYRATLHRLQMSDGAGPVAALCVTNDDSRVVAMDEAGRITSWTFSPNRLEYIADDLSAQAEPTPRSRCWSIAIDSLGQPFAARYDHHRRVLEVFDTQAGTIHLSLEVELPSRPVVTLASDASHVAFATRAGEVEIHDCRFPARRSIRSPLRVSALSLTEGGQRLAIGGDARDGGAIEVWNLNDSKRDARWLAHSDGVATLAFDATRTRLISNGVAGSVRVWNAQDGRTLDSDSRVHGGRLTSLAWIDGARLASADGGGRLAVWDVDQGARRVQLVRAFAPPPELAVPDPKPSDGAPRVGPVVREDGRVAVASSACVHLYDVGGRVPARSYSLEPWASRFTLTALPFRGLTAIGTDSRTFAAFDLANGRSEWRDLGSHPAALSKDGRWLVWRCQDKMVIRDGRGRLTSIVRGMSAFDRLAWAQDGDRLVVHETNGRNGVLVWVDLRSGNQLERHDVPQGFEVTALATSADGRVAVVADGDGVLWTYRVGTASAAAPARLSIGEPIGSLAIRPDGRVLAVSTTKGELHLWELPAR